MQARLKKAPLVKKIIKTNFYSRLRKYFPMQAPFYLDDRASIGDAEVVQIDWPEDLPRPRVGIVQDYGNYPRWTKYCRFFDHNCFPYEIYNIHAHDWLEVAQRFDVIVGVPSNEFNYLHEIRRKYFALATFYEKFCYPSVEHLTLYEDKSVEAFLAEKAGIPFVKTYVSNDKTDALQIIRTLKYPVVCKNESSSGSVGVELIRNLRQAEKVVNKAFSIRGKSTHLLYLRQKDYIYFQEFVPNDGFDVRAIVVGNWGFGYYRRNLEGDFRASGMNQVELRGLPEEPLRIAWEANKILKSPVLVMDMLHGLDGKYHVIEYSPLCEVNTPVQLKVDGESGVYIREEDGKIRFEKARYWLHELALKQFFVADYLPQIRRKS